MQTELELETPLPGPAQLWRLEHGSHPELPEVVRLSALLKPDFSPGAPQTYPDAIPVTSTHRGHHLLTDDAYLGALAQTDRWALAPVYVRDLAGRVLHTGLRPQPLCPATPLTPESCVPVPEDHPGMALLEQVFLFELRRLEQGAHPGFIPDQASDRLHAAIYPAPQRYPYKLRPDTFYQDGFRLPQLTRLHVQNAAPALAQTAAEEFMQRWRSRPEGQDYESFYTANQGETWYQELFLQGCTVIPTVEAYNGWFQVTSEFGMADVYPGQAVTGLHDIIGREASTLPAGTILRVEQPGCATRQGIQLAKVTVSDGSGYQVPFPDEPAPLLPDLVRPHPRVGGTWGDVWLPTAPGHFVRPALWDWDATGHFQQVSGPLWDPLHYVYGSTSRMLRAIRRAPYGFAPVPEEMKPRFYPVIAQTSYDTHNARTLQDRRQSLPADHPLYDTAIDTLPLPQVVAEVGYHPLPAALEYEIDPAVMPALGPNRFGACPPDLTGRLAPVIHSHITPEVARQYTVSLTEPETILLTDEQRFPPGDGTPYNDYPQLRRGSPLPALEDIAAIMPFVLRQQDQTELFPNVRRLFTRYGYRQELTALHPDMPARLQAFAESGYSWRRRRYRAWRRYLPGYLNAWWSLTSLELALTAAEEDAAPALRSVVLAQQPSRKPSY